MYNKLNDKVNEAQQFVQALADLTAPILGSVIFDGIGMRSTFDVNAIFNFLFAIVLFAYNCGFNFVENDKKFKKELAKYQSQSVDGQGVAGQESSEQEEKEGGSIDEVRLQLD